MCRFLQAFVDLRHVLPGNERTASRAPEILHSAFGGRRLCGEGLGRRGW